MKVKLFAIFALVLVFALSLSASTTTLTGVLTDDMCTKKHMMPGKANADCVRECIKHGAKYVLVAQKKVFEIQAKQALLSPVAGKKVTISGELKGNTIVATSVEAVN